MSLTLSDFFNTRTEQETLEPVVLYDGAVIGHTGKIPLLMPLTDFELLEFYSEFTASGSKIGLETTQIPSTQVLDKKHSNTLLTSRYVSAAANVEVRFSGADSTPTSIGIQTTTSTSWTDPGVYKVVGYRRRISSVGIDELMSAMSLPNLCANADLSINQRNFDGNWAGLAIGAYGYDQWMKVSDTHMGYVIEEGFYKPNSLYTVTKDDVAAGTFISPASGHFAVSVPFATSGKFDIYMGQFKRPWHPVQDGLERCQRHFQTSQATSTLPVTVAGSTTAYLYVSFLSAMRVTPTVTRTGNGSVTNSTEGSEPNVVSRNGFHFSKTSTAPNRNVLGGAFRADATITLAELAVYDVISKQWTKQATQISEE